MHPLEVYRKKREHIVIGLMSGTSADGIDAVLLKVSGFGMETTVEPYPAGKSFLFVPFSDKVREAILRMAGGEALSAEEYCKLNALLGHLYAEACLKLAEQAGLRKENVDLVGCHGQTVWHAPMQEEYLGKRFGSTLQIGDASVISEEVGCLSVSDFRVRDVAAGGQGAPLVPYTDFLLYRDAKQDTALQNIGGIGNVTILPADCSLADVRGFDTGPGNMLLDALAERITDGKCRYDKDGLLARQGNICDFLLHEMLDDPYLAKIPPKTTGREKYGLAYLKDLFEKADYYGLTDIDLLATCTRYTAECIKLGICRFGGIEPRRLIVTGGGSRNPLLMEHLRDLFPGCSVMTGEEFGLDGDAKEAAAFALLANEAVYASANNVPSVTGARHPVVMGKISM